MSTSQGRAYIHVLSDASPILRDVMTEVLNDTAFVDVRFSLNGQDSFYLVQTDQKRVQEDWDQLQRLGTMFNVTMHAGDTHVDLRLRSPALLLNIRYGGSPSDEKKRLRSATVDTGRKERAHGKRIGHRVLWNERACHGSVHRSGRRSYGCHIPQDRAWFSVQGLKMNGNTHLFACGRIYQAEGRLFKVQPPHPSSVQSTA
ncbi:teneurin-m [Trichonephila clavipes]|nr:teneurin-m [Trichonephila clavipes]